MAQAGRSGRLGVTRLVWHQKESSDGVQYCATKCEEVGGLLREFDDPMRQIIPGQRTGPISLMSCSSLGSLQDIRTWVRTHLSDRDTR
jgi:hypothetical protein